MQVRLWGTRGSVARAGPGTVAYGGDTSSVQVSTESTCLALDAGSGIVPLGDALLGNVERIDLLLTHLHMDHIQGLGFFRPLFDPEIDVHIWGPVSTTMDLATRLRRYLSPPLFPVRLRDLDVTLHDVHPGTFQIGDLQITADLVIHPGATVGYRIESPGGSTVCYLPDHEPALGSRHDLAEGGELLLHDTQYTAEEYAARTGWGHSTLDHAMAFAALTGVAELVTFHHDPEHDDAFLDRHLEEATARWPGDLPFAITPGRPGAVFELA
jgi:phosphoribosyl 1,2-cyclic phosphodiesterase